MKLLHGLRNNTINLRSYSEIFKCLHWVYSLLLDHIASHIIFLKRGEVSQDIHLQNWAVLTAIMHYK